MDGNKILSPTPRNNTWSRWPEHLPVNKKHSVLTTAAMGGSNRASMPRMYLCICAHCSSTVGHHNQPYLAPPIFDRSTGLISESVRNAFDFVSARPKDCLYVTLSVLSMKTAGKLFIFVQRFCSLVMGWHTIWHAGSCWQIKQAVCPLWIGWTIMAGSIHRL